MPVVGLMDAHELEDYLELRDPKVREHIRKSRQDFLAGKSSPTSAPKFSLVELHYYCGLRREETYR
jgi:hypothetical protein